MKFNIKLNTCSAFLILLFLTFSFLAACNQNDSSRQFNPDNSPQNPSDNGGPISTPPDSNPTDGGGDSGGGSGTPGGSGGSSTGDDDDAVMDDPTPPDSGTGEIRGTVESSTGTPLNGVHVRAINVDKPNLQISSFSGIDTDLMLVDGAFSIQNVPPGTYRVLIERLDGNPAAFQTNRYSPFIIAEATTLVFPDEYWNGANESSTDDIMEIETVIVADGMTVNGINFITND